MARIRSNTSFLTTVWFGLFVFIFHSEIEGKKTTTTFLLKKFCRKKNLFKHSISASEKLLLTFEFQKIFKMYTKNTVVFLNRIF